MITYKRPVSFLALACELSTAIAADHLSHESSMGKAMHSLSGSTDAEWCQVEYVRKPHAEALCSLAWESTHATSPITLPLL